MKIVKKFIVLLTAFSLLLGASAPALAADSDESLQFTSISAVLADGTAVIASEIDGAEYLFLPSGVSPEAVTLCFDLSESGAVASVQGTYQASVLQSGDVLDLPALCGEGESYTLTLHARSDGGEIQQSLVIMFASGIANMFLTSDDPENHGRTWVEASADKSNKATGSLLMQDAEGETIYDGGLTQIKGRGNSTWLAAKKPYQIKLSDKCDLLESGDKDNRAKTWVLLTNGADSSMLRSSVVYDLAYAMGLSSAVQCRPVNLYYDGEYRGLYLLCEKVEIKSGRIDITDLEELTEDANPDTDLESLPSATGTTANGATYIYKEGVQNPENITGGYLLEMDTAIRAAEEACYFTTRRGVYVVVKSPEFCSKEQMDYIASYYQEYEDTLYAGGTNPTNGKDLSAYMSIESLAQNYIINELTKNPDGYRTSSYLYKDADNDVMTMAPVWDYDLSFGLGWGIYAEECAKAEGFFTTSTPTGAAMYRVPAVRQAIHDIYENTVAPLINETLLGTAEAELGLQSLTAYQSEIAAAAKCNCKFWGSSYKSFRSSCTNVRNYLTTRNAYLTEALASWSADSETETFSGFFDVSSDAWYRESVVKCSAYGLMNGTAYAVFSPETLATRAQTAQVLYRLHYTEDASYTGSYTDVAESAWYAAAVSWGDRTGVIQGYPDNTFHPDDTISRQDVVVLLYRACGSPEPTQSLLSGYSDQDQVASYARNAVEWALECGILQGYGDGTLGPTGNLRRCELAALMVRYYELVNSAG